MQKKTAAASVIAIVALLAFFIFLYQRAASPVSVSYPPGTKMPEPINIKPRN